MFIRRNRHKIYPSGNIGILGVEKVDGKMKEVIRVLIVLLCSFACLAKAQSQDSIGELVNITLTGKIHGFGKNYDPDIYSPKSAVFSKDGLKMITLIIFKGAGITKINAFPRSFSL